MSFYPLSHDYHPNREKMPESSFQKLFGRNGAPYSADRRGFLAYPDGIRLRSHQCFLALFSPELTMLTISRRIAAVACFCLLNANAWAQVAATDNEGWIDIFNGKDLTGWKISAENPETFKVENGELVVKGDRAHLFYDGDVADHNFKNFRGGARS